MHKRPLCWAAFAYLLVGVSVVWSQAGDKASETVKAFLTKAHPGKKWQSGPKRIEGAALATAYKGGQKFYYVFSAPPLPPGARLPRLIEAYKAKYKDYRANYISATVRLDGAGKIVPLTKLSDYNNGLMPVKNEADVKVAAAAVLSLCGAGRVPPGTVKVAEVKVTRTDKGWRGVVHRKNQFQGFAEFDKKGQVVRLSKTFTGPVPP